MSSPRVLIVGASIAGPTAAYWFAKAGASVTVIERFPELRKGGQNIDIRSAGVTVMRKMQGMEPAVRAALCPLDGITFVRPEDGRRIAVMRSTGDPDAQSLVSEYEIYRGELARVLYGLTRDNERITYVFGEQIKSIRQQGGGDDGPVAVEFANGYPAAEYDLVVACDGATSRTRAMGFGCGVRHHIRTLNAWAAYFTIDKDLLDGSRLGHAISAPGGRFVALATDPDGRNKVCLMSVYPRSSSTDDATLPFREAVRDGDAALRSFVDKRFRGSGWVTDEVLDRMAESKDFYASEMVQVKIPSLYNGRLTVVGDAGYASGPTGQGTSMAMAGAYYLAGEICKSNGDIAAGLRGYEERMRPLIAEAQKIPPGVPGLIAPQTVRGIWLRNLAFRFICWMMRFKGLFTWVSSRFSGAFGGDKYGLPDYDWKY